MKELFLAVVKSGSSSFLKLLFNVLGMKVIAVMLGPAGVGMFSLIRQLSQTFSVIGLGGQTAIVQGLSGRKHEQAKHEYIKTAFWVFTLGSVLTVSALQIFSTQLAEFMFGTADQESVYLVRWISLPVVLFNFYFYLKSIINGYREIGLLALIEVIGPFALILAVYPVCQLVEGGGYLWFVWLLSLTQLVMIVSSLKVIRAKRWFDGIRFFSPTWMQADSWDHFKQVASVVIITSFFSMASIFIVKSTIARELGVESTGLFDLAWSVSSAYVMIVLTAFGTYYLPSLTERGASDEGRQLIGRTLRLSMMMMLPIILILIAAKPMVVSLLYSEQFMEALDLLKWMLIADYLKVTTWVFAIAVIATGDMKIYFFVETAWYAAFAALSVSSVTLFGSMSGIAISFLILYVLLLVFYLVYIDKRYRYRLRPRIILPWLVGLALIAFSSFLTWDLTEPSWMLVILSIVGIPAYAFWLLEAEEKQGLRKLVIRN